MKSKTTILSAAAIALLLLAACGSSNPLGGVFGGGNNSSYTNDIRGTVDSVDLSSNSIYLINVSNSNGSMLSNSGGGGGVRVYFDNRTTVDYNGKSYRPADLERGDQVDVRVDQSGNQLYASSMSVTYNARNSGSYPSGSYPSGSNPTNTYPNNGTYNTTLRGTVRSIDTYRRTISLDTGYNGTTMISYDTNTPVYFNGRNYLPADLEVGDQIDVRVGNNNFAQDITVTRSISNGTGSTGTYGQTNNGTIRGTVSYVDTTNRTIQLQSVSYTGFNRNTQGGGTITVSYDNNTNVDVNGQTYPVSGLERGDVVDVQVSNNSTYGNGNGNNYFANRIYLVRDVRQ